MSDERIAHLIALAALGELTDAQQLELDAAIVNDPVATGELVADLETAAVLQAIHREQPAASVKVGVMAAIATVEQEPGRSPKPLNRSASVTAIGEAPKARRLRWQSLTAAAAAVLFVVGGLLFAAGDTDKPSFAAIVQSNDAEVRTLDGTLGGILRIVYSPQARGYAIDGSDIPVLGDDQTYELWLIDDDGARPAGLFRPDDSGRVTATFTDLDPTAFEVAVTVEPASGSDVATGPIVAST